MRFLYRLKSVPLRTKIVVPVAVVLALAFACIAAAAGYVLKNQLVDSSERMALQRAQIAELSLRRAMLSGRNEEIADDIRLLGQRRDLPRIALRFPEGGYLIEKQDEGHELPPDRSTPPPGQSRVTQIRADGESYTRVTSAIANEPSCYSCHGPSERTLGYLEVDLSNRWLEQRVEQSYVGIAWVAGLTLLLVWLAIAASLHAAVIRPLGALSNAMSVVQEGRREVRLAPDSEDEIGRLNEAFNRMVDEVSAAEASLVDTERQLAEAEKLAGIGLMAAGVAHEINNPLAAVSVAAEMLNIGALTEEQRASLSKSVLEGTERIQKIVSEMLTLDRRQGLQTEPEDPVLVLRQALHSVDVPATIRVRFKVREALPRIQVNRDRIARAIGNMIKNAVQAMPDGGELCISAEPEDQVMKIEIADTGIGMPPEVLEHIFDPFFSTKEVGKGFGLGLAFAHSTIVQHGGEVSAQSQQGVGTTFAVLVPLAEEQQENA